MLKAPFVFGGGFLRMATLGEQERAGCFLRQLVKSGSVTQKARLSFEKRAFLLYGDFNVHPLSFMRQDIEGNRKAHVKHGPKYLERETGFEPATSTLARLHSTTELLPRGGTKVFL